MKEKVCPVSPVHLPTAATGKSIPSLWSSPGAAFSIWEEVGLFQIFLSYILQAKRMTLWSGKLFCC